MMKLVSILGICILIFTVSCSRAFLPGKRDRTVVSEGAVTDADLPFQVEVDYVKVY